MIYPACPLEDRRRGWVSFGISGFVHGTLLAWVLVAAAQAPREVRRSIYDQEIRPYENHLVWYNLREKLPDIKPAPAPAEKPAPARPRARRKFPQTLVSGPKDDDRVPQTIVTDAPPAELPKPLPLPNAVAEAAPAPPPPRAFTPPAAAVPEAAPPPVLPDSPNIEGAPPAPANPLEAAMPRPRARPFEPPPARSNAGAGTGDAALPELPEAPKVAAANSRAPASLPGAAPPRPRPLPFTAPAPLVRSRTAAPLTLPEAPRVEAIGAGGPGGGGAAGSGRLVAPRIPRNYSPPASRRGAHAAPPAIDAPAPAVTRPGATGSDSFAIAGLNPSKLTGVPVPPVSHQAGFSGGPELHAGGGGAASNDKAALVVPSLTASGGAHDSQPTVAPAAEPSARSRLLAELRSPLSPHPPTPFSANAPRAMRVSSAPDPRMEGRVIYTMAIQMPNVTSHSGSWMVWFAERIPEPGASLAVVRPPVPLHKVDPAYVRTAVDEHIEGAVKLAAVIRKDGRVEQIEVLSGIDARLDRSAEEALGKWLFEPAARDGKAIDVDAVFEVPFRLAPKPTR